MAYNIEIHSQRSDCSSCVSPCRTEVEKPSLLIMTSISYLFPNSDAKDLSYISTNVEKVFVLLLLEQRRQCWGGWRWRWWWDNRVKDPRDHLGRTIPVPESQGQAEGWDLDIDPPRQLYPSALQAFAIASWWWGAPLTRVGLVEVSSPGSDYTSLTFPVASCSCFDSCRQRCPRWLKLKVGNGLRLAPWRWEGLKAEARDIGGKSADFQAENSTWALQHPQWWPAIDFQRSQAPSDLGLLRFPGFPTHVFCYRKHVFTRRRIKTNSPIGLDHFPLKYLQKLNKN